MNISWAWLLIGLAIGYFVVPMLAGMLRAKRTPQPAA